ncbi:MAG: DUF4861 domain-containing protein [Sphingobacteriales bacterium UTBCD1]|jgi:hypothetical protein|nr:MAG: DUF4861 domain-containing protein [Sphingobacteriales bacterium UTBCD1]
MRVFILFAAGLFLKAQACYCQAIVDIKNPLDIARNEEVLSVPWAEILKAYPSIDTTMFIVFNSNTGKQLPYQLEYRDSKQVQNLLILVSLPANGKLVLQIKKGVRDAFPDKTYCRYVPERKEDFAWENDKIAFRMYGKALESTDENAYGMDVWVKRTDSLILNERYKRGEYHIDHGDGLDYYHVGFSLGAGDSDPYVDDSIWYSKNYHYWKVLDNGPLRSAFELEYDEWNVSGQEVRVTKTISLDAGSQLSRVEDNYYFSKTPVMPVVTGIVKRNEPGAEFFDERNGVMGYWEPKNTQDGTTGVGCVFLRAVQQMMMKKGHLLTESLVKPGQALIYYTGAAWDRAGEITSSEQWFGYLQSFKKKLEHPLQITVKK